MLDNQTPTKPQKNDGYEFIKSQMKALGFKTVHCSTLNHLRDYNTDATEVIAKVELLESHGMQAKEMELISRAGHKMSFIFLENIWE